MDIAIVIIEILVAIVCTAGHCSIRIWEDGKPGGGFVPVIFASLLLVVSLTILIRVVIGKKNTQEPYRFQAGAYLPAAAAVVALL